MRVQRRLVLTVRCRLLESVMAISAIFLSAGCDELSTADDAPVPVQSMMKADTFSAPVVIHRPAGPPTIPTGLNDADGRGIEVACAVCHTTKPANPQARIGVSRVLFHQGLEGKHGNLTCVSCHHPDDGYASLRLADNRRVDFQDVMTLCAQCHGPQFRDYEHGAHGGMTGFWDRARGSRVRNNCIDCHNPHDPKYPIVQPAPPPNDRFPSGGRHE